MVTLALAVLTVVLLSALCSGTEAGLFSISKIKVRQMAEAGKPTAKILLNIQENMARPIGAIVVLNNIFNIVGTMVVGALLTSNFADMSFKLGPVEITYQQIGTAVFTLLIILFSEIIPKTLGEQYSDRVSMIMARPVALVAYILTPLLWALEKVTEPLSKNGPTYTTNEAEIRLMASMGEKEGIIEKDEGEMIQRVFELNDLTAGDILTPRVVVTSLSASASLAEAQEAILNSNHSRLIVSGKDIDEIVGVALKEDLLKGLIQGNGDALVSEFVKDVRFVPKQIKADELLIYFRLSRQHLCVVLDEFGGLAGVVTLEDVLEVLTGEIMDETDAWENLQEVAKEKRKSRLESMEQGKHQEKTDP